MPFAQLVLGIAVLVLGRQLYWVFVGVAGFVIGLEVARRALGTEAGWVVVLGALFLGLVGALLAVVFQYVAVGAAGFALAGHAAVRGLERFGAEAATWSWLAFVVAGIVGVVLVLVLFDWALIVLSSLAGATLIIDAVGAGPVTAPLALVGLTAAGVVVQAALLRWVPASRTPGAPEAR